MSSSRLVDLVPGVMASGSQGPLKPRFTKHTASLLVGATHKASRFKVREIDLSFRKELQSVMASFAA